MADYSKKKVDELQDLLKKRSLPHTGKKAELVKRLEQSDADEASAAAELSTSSETIKPSTDDAPSEEASVPAAAAAVAAGGKGQPPNPQAVPNQIADTDPSTTDELTVKQPAADISTNAAEADAEEAQQEESFASHLPPSNLTSELEKRKKRLERFGTGATSQVATEAQKALERAKRFGTGAGGEGVTGVGGLDQALPERMARKRGRGRGKEGDAQVEGEREGKRRDSRKRAPAATGKGTSREQGDRDRAAAEARRKKFGTATGK